jgi:hypothetical protein
MNQELFKKIFDLPSSISFDSLSKNFSDSFGKSCLRTFFFNGALFSDGGDRRFFGVVKTSLASSPSASFKQHSILLFTFLVIFDSESSKYFLT